MMATMSKNKQEWLRRVSGKTLENILGDLKGAELHEKSPEYPLGGLVHIEGIGQIEVGQLRLELKRRRDGRRD